MQVYADLVIITNFIFDLLLLILTARIRNVQVKKMRFILASLLGAFYSIFLLYPELSLGYTLLSKLLFSAFMIWIAFGKMGMWAFIQSFLTFYGVSIFMGGGIFALQYLSQQSVTVSGGIAFSYGKPSYLFIAVSFFILWWFAEKGYKSLKVTRQKETQYVKTHIEIHGATLSCTGFIDTGNQLYDALSRTPVTITELSLWKETLPLSLYEWISTNDTLTTPPSDVPAEWVGRIRLIPYRTVSSQSSFLVALRPDKVSFEKDGIEYCPEKMLIGLRTGSLASDGSYQAVVHSCVLQGYSNEIAS